MEASSMKDQMEDHGPELAGTEKQPYQKPELIKHQKLSEITLGIQCNGTVPPCSPVQDPFN